MSITKEQFEKLEVGDVLGYDRWHHWQVISVDQDNQTVTFLGPVREDRFCGAWDNTRSWIVDQRGNPHEGLNDGYLKLYPESVSKVIKILVAKYNISPEDLSRLNKAIGEEEHCIITNAILG